jgi:hypothetical protein
MSMEIRIYHLSTSFITCPPLLHIIHNDVHIAVNNNREWSKR